MSHDDFAFEPVPGLPAPLPKGERILWQGSPRWQSLARTAYYVNIVARCLPACLRSPSSSQPPERLNWLFT
jgi:hypothetical protein